MSVVVLMLQILVTSCNEDRTVYDEYVETPIAGWEKMEGVTFCVPAMKNSGDFAPCIQIRNTNSYPFVTLVLRVERLVYPSGQLKIDTLNVEITDEKGKYKPRGVMYHNHIVELSRQRLMEGDSMVVHVNHCMKRSMLPSIAGIGFRITE